MHLLVYKYTHVCLANYVSMCACTDVHTLKFVSHILYRVYLNFEGVMQACFKYSASLCETGVCVCVCGGRGML